MRLYMVTLKKTMLSIVIPAFNEEKLLAHSLSQLIKSCNASSTLKDSYEIIVCDNNSTDATPDIARELGCEVIFEPVNQISLARNTGARIAKGEWLLFLDADSWPSKELMQDVTSVFAAPQIIGCGSTIRIVDGPKWYKFILESKNWSMRIWKWSFGAFILCRRNAFTNIGGFLKEHFFFEELEFIKRLKKYGKTNKQKFVVFSKNPYSSSGRKAESTDLWYWIKFAFKFVIRPKQLVRDKEFAKSWYNVKR